MYTLRSIARRGVLFGAVAALVAATVAPSAAVFADSLNPLTNRSLLLSSSAPGYQNTDGSGNSEDSPNAIGENYAPPGSGPNGRKTGETFTFNVSTDSSATGTNEPILGFSLQYCTTAAGLCQGPGNNSGDSRTSDRALNEGTDGGWENNTSDLNVVTDATTPWSGGTGAGQFQIYTGSTPETMTPVDMTGWTMSTDNVEDDLYNDPNGSSALTGKQNYIVLSSDGTGTPLAPKFNDSIKIVFTPSSTNYITNPGAGAFFVKINTYKTGEAGVDNANLMPATEANVIDGGVTVANVMTESIHITTKVLETMKFSVGTQNPDTQPVQHGSCDAINVVNGNRLDLGNPSAESSLSTEQAYDVYSYWRLSSNSSGGAVVYYSGDTLKNTVGDEIAPIGQVPVTAPFGGKAYSQPGTEQFGLALIDAGQDTPDPGASTPDTNDADADGNTTEMIRPFPANWQPSHISPLVVDGNYADGGYVDADTDGAVDDLLPISNETSSENAQFAYDTSSLTSPVPIASETDKVISCATAKVRYVGNIAADTPAGVYTTKINYLAAPQY